MLSEKLQLLILSIFLTLLGCSQDNKNSTQSTGIVNDSKPSDANETDWAIENSLSPVNGQIITAAFISGNGTISNPLRKITIACIKNTRQLEVKFQAEPAIFNFEMQTLSMFGQSIIENVPKGRALTALKDTPINAASILRMPDNINVAELIQKDSDHQNGASYFASLLPLAIELESNIGTIVYEIPRSNLVMSVVEQCATDPSVKLARDNLYAELETAKSELNDFFVSNNKETMLWSETIYKLKNDLNDAIIQSDEKRNIVLKLEAESSQTLRGIFVSKNYKQSLMDAQNALKESEELVAQTKIRISDAEQAFATYSDNYKSQLEHIKLKVSTAEDEYNKSLESD